MADNQYILSFDFDTITRNIESLQRTYVAFSDEIKKSNEQTSPAFDELQTKLTSLTNTVNTSFQSISTYCTSISEHTAKMSGSLKNVHSYMKDIVKRFKELEKVNLSQLGITRQDFGISDKDKSVDIGINKDSILKLRAEIEEIREQIKSKDGVSTEEDVKKKVSKTQVAIASALKRLLPTAATNVSSMISKGGIVGGLLGMIIEGIEFQQQKGAERGEMLNAVEAAEIGRASCRERVLAMV
jgi:hypothetical protein